MTFARFLSRRVLNVLGSTVCIVGASIVVNRYFLWLSHNEVLIILCERRHLYPWTCYIHYAVD